MDVGSAARGGDEWPLARGGVVFDPSGGGGEFCQRGNRGGTKVKFYFGRQRWQKNHLLLIVLEQNFKFFEGGCIST